MFKIPSSYFPRILNFIAFFQLTHFKKRTKFSTNILSINTHDQSGGASKIAYQIAQYSQAYFTYSFFAGIKKRNETWIYEIPKMVDNALTAILQYHERVGGWLDFSKLGALQLRKNKLFIDARILHFHNLHGYYFSYALLPVLGKGKRVIWTLHDEHVLTGHCAFTMQCDRWKSGCGKCPSLEVYPAIKEDNTLALLQWKKKWIAELNPIIVSPSHWLAERFKCSYPGVLDVRVIHNGVDIDVFTPREKVSLRKEFNLPEDKFLVLFVAEFATENPFKGGEIVREVIQNNTTNEICFVTIGSEKKSFSSHHIELPYIALDNELARLYAACDVLFYPTNADNFPLVVLEAMGCGLPVIASDIAGIPEIILDGINGFLVKGYSPVSRYEDTLKKVFEMRHTEEFVQLSLNARQQIVERFSLTEMLFNYQSLYNSIFEKTG